MAKTKFVLTEKSIPKAWYNIQADLPQPLPPVIHPGTGEPIGPDDLAPLFPMAVIGQEVSQERWIEIPDPVRDVLRLWRPTPLFRARRLEQALDTPAHIYYKYEGVSPAGSHKPNTAIAQAFYNKEEGVKGLTTETGAGQWGSSLAMACNFFDLECEVYMVKVSYQQKPYRRSLMQTFGASVTPSPSDQTNAGRSILEQDPESPGSLGIAISEAVEAAATSGGAKKYSLGSVLNHVLLHQTVIGLEALEQFELAEEYPDVAIGCVGGGSNFGGFALPFVRENLTSGKKTRIIAVEPTAAPSLTKGRYIYDFGDTAASTPLLKMFTLGHTFIPAPVHAGGLRYHGDGADRVGAPRAGADRGRGRDAEPGLRGGRPLRARRGHHPGPRGGARHPRRDRRGARGEGGRRGEGHRLQPLRPRPLRHGRLRRVLRRQPPGLRVRRVARRGGAFQAPDGGRARVRSRACRSPAAGLYARGPPRPEGDTHTMDPEPTMRRLYELLTAGDVDSFGDLLADDFVEHEELPGLTPTKEGVIALFRMYIAAFPDLRMVPEDVLTSGDKAVARVRVTGTHQGEFMGMSATGKAVDVRADRHHPLRRRWARARALGSLRHDDDDATTRRSARRPSRLDASGDRRLPSDASPEAPVAGRVSRD